MCKPNTGDENTVELDEFWLKTSFPYIFIYPKRRRNILGCKKGPSETVAVLDENTNSQFLPVILMVFPPLQRDVNIEKELLFIH